MSGLQGAASGDGYVTRKGLPYHKTKDPGWFRLFPVMNHLGMESFFFSSYGHNWYNPSDPKASKQYVCPLKNKIGDHMMGTYCPACEVYAPLEEAYKAAIEQYVAAGQTEEQAKLANQAMRDLAGSFRPKWKAYAPSVGRAKNEFGWLGMSGSLISCVKNLAKNKFGDEATGINKILDPTTGFDLHLSHPTRTTWAVDINQLLPTPLFSQGAETLQAVIDKWCDDLAQDLAASKASGKPSKIDKMHKFESTPQDMYEAAAIWAQRLGVAPPTAPAGAQTASAPVALPANPAMAALVPPTVPVATPQLVPPGALPAAAPQLIPPGALPQAPVAQPAGVPLPTPQPAMTVPGGAGGPVGF